MDKSCCWLEDIADLKLVQGEDLQEMLKEGDELTRFPAGSGQAVQANPKF